MLFITSVNFPIPLDRNSPTPDAASPKLAPSSLICFPNSPAGSVDSDRVFTKSPMPAPKSRIASNAPEALPIKFPMKFIALPIAFPTILTAEKIPSNTERTLSAASSVSFSEDMKSLNLLVMSTNVSTVIGGKMFLKAS